jgi:hypothetical protein
MVGRPLGPARNLTSGLTRSWPQENNYRTVQHAVRTMVLGFREKTGVMYPT